MRGVDDDDLDPLTLEGASFGRRLSNDFGVDAERYEVEGEIARGGHAIVLRAIDRRLQRPVAIKQLRRRAASGSRFLIEALITARLRHPSIVPIYDVGCWSDGTPYFAMELVEGTTLRDRVVASRSRRERLALLSSVIAVTDAVAYAHRQRIIHRDLKPSNILVSDFGQTIVIDWGIAKDLAVDPDSDRRDARWRGLAPGVATVVGTPNYMSPEQAAGAEVDERTDIYALGAIVYHLISGRAPYAEIAADEVIGRVRRGPPTALAERFPGVSRALVAVVERAMARDPRDRYRSAAELRDDLADFRRSSDRAAG